MHNIAEPGKGAEGCSPFPFSRAKQYFSGNRYIFRAEDSSENEKVKYFSSSIF